METVGEKERDERGRESVDKGRQKVKGQSQHTQTCTRTENFYNKTFCVKIHVHVHIHAHVHGNICSISSISPVQSRVAASFSNISLFIM